MAKRRTLKGGLAENMDIVEKAKQRALEARRLIPTRVEVSPGHWIFKMVEPSEAVSGVEPSSALEPSSTLEPQTGAQSESR